MNYLSQIRMRRFTALYKALESSTKINDKLEALVSYLNDATEDDRLWMIALLTDRKPKRTLQSKLLKSWGSEMSRLPDWLLEESYNIVGDVAEAVSLTLPLPKVDSNLSLAEWILQIVDQKTNTEEEQKAFVIHAWACLNQDERFIFNKLIIGGFKINVSQKTIAKAISLVIQKDENKVAHKLMSEWSPMTMTYQDLLINTDWESDASKPFPFYHTHYLDTPVEELGPPDKWQAEWKWDGLRSQLIKRNKELFLWSSDQELVTDKYPEFQPLAALNDNDFVIDGELVVLKDDEIRPFIELQKRTGRKTIGKKILTDYPCVIIAYDLLEHEGEDLRGFPLHERHYRLEKLIRDISESCNSLIFLSQSISFSSWKQLSDIRNDARGKRAKGLILKLKNSAYKNGRHKGEWWKWNTDPYTIDAVMLYAQKSQENGSNLFSEFTFAVWANDDTLIPFTKANGGLTEKELKDINAFIKKNTIERFGPVRSVKPELVFEIEFEGINESKRHKCGVTLRSAKIKSWRKEKSAEEAGILKDLIQLIK